MDARPLDAKRLPAIDALRGTVMIVMALDHTRDFLHIGAMSFSPTDLAKTTPLLFFTRWITHFCMPVFVFAAGMGAFLYRRRHTTRQLSRFLWTRGLWLVLLELTVMRLAYDFSFSPRFMVLLLILWIFGLCMIAMAALVYLPLRWLAVLSVTVVALHNCLDSIQAARFHSPASAAAWMLLHQPGVFTIAGHPVLAPYPLIPWLAVMAAGFCFAKVFLLDPASRQRIALTLGLAMTIAFVALRAINRYGDPVPWSAQKSSLFTLLSFLNCTKYPASLDFLLMTLGPALLLLALYDRCAWKPANPLIVFGRVPLFYFVCHFYAGHALAVLLAWHRYGRSASAFVFQPVPSMGGPSALLPPNFGYPLWAVYAAWILIVLLLYPLCRWFARVKAAHPSQRWLSYL
jgi:uncharacterized membrane protein